MSNIPLNDLPLFWEGRSRALTIINERRASPDPTTAAEAAVYLECANELRIAIKEKK